MNAQPHALSDGSMSCLPKALGDRPSPDGLVTGHGFHLPQAMIDAEPSAYPVNLSPISPATAISMLSLTSEYFP
jgi:hypothetical protein